MDKLTEICQAKLEHIKKQKQKISTAVLEDLIRNQSIPRGFTKALRTKYNDGEFGLIAEVKKASPSKGIIRADFSPEIIATNYADGGAACLSVLTDIPYFLGSDEYLKTVREAISLPILRKDFILDVYQITESRSLGADCILLIMAALSDDQAAELEAAAHEYGMDVLAEVHDAKEAERALKLKTQMIGVNNRSLKTLEVDLNTSIMLSGVIPANILRVCESGITHHTDLLKMREFGYNSFLVGESLMREKDITLATKNLLGNESKASF